MKTTSQEQKLHNFLELQELFFFLNYDKLTHDHFAQLFLHSPVNVQLYLQYKKKYF